jgi:hypothetical protein
MFFGIDLNQTFSFPFKDAEARKHFLIGCLVSLTTIIIPILPFFVLYGYAIRIVKQIMNNETPHMVAWDDWGGMFKDGAKMFGIRIIYSIPIMILAIPLFISMFAMPIFMSDISNSQADTLFPIFMLIVFGTLCVLIPISLPLSVIIPGAEMYVVDKDEFAAGFRIREWWPILRANLSGFIAAFAIFYLATMVMSLAIQIIGATLIFACLLPFLLPVITMYTTLIMYTTIAQAYKVGREKLALAENSPIVTAQ